MSDRLRTERYSASPTSSSSDSVASAAAGVRALTPIEVEVEAPEGWREGIPKPWHLRDPLYNKPLPVPTRTPSPSLSPASDHGHDADGRFGMSHGQSHSPRPSAHHIVSPNTSPTRSLAAQASAGSPHPGISARVDAQVRELLKSPAVRGADAKSPQLPLSPSAQAEQTEMETVNLKSPSLAESKEAEDATAASWKDQKDKDLRGRRKTVPGVTEAFVPSAWKRVASQPASPKPIEQASPVAGEDADVIPANLIHVMPAAGEHAIQGKLVMDPTTGLIKTVFRRGNKDDWKVEREHAVDKFFEAWLFDEDQEHQQASLHARQQEKSAIKPCRRGNKADWQVQRQHFVDEFFEPSLFDQQPAQPPIHAKSQTEQPRAKGRYRRGNKDDWQVEREHAVDEFFEPTLFAEGYVAQFFGLPAHAAAGAPAATRRGNKHDWQVKRKHFVDEFFEPALFLQADMPRHILSIPLRDRQQDHAYEPWPVDAHPESLQPCRKGNKNDWQVQRVNAVDDFFEPWLFDEALQLASKQTDRQYIFRRGRKSDWQAWRKHGVDRFFVPSLFFRRTRILSAGDWLRKDWRSPRRFSINHFFTPHLFDLPPRPLVSLFDHYRQDWQTERVNDVDAFFEPALFDEHAQPVMHAGKRDLRSPLPMTPKKRMRASSSAFISDDMSPQQAAEVLFHKLRDDLAASSASTPRSIRNSPLVSAHSATRSVTIESAQDVESKPSAESRPFEDYASAEEEPESVADEDVESWFQDATVVEARARLAWQAFLTSSDSTISSDFLLGHLVANGGIPSDLRRDVWCQLAGGMAVLSTLADLYPVLLETHSMAALSADMQLRLDSILLDANTHENGSHSQMETEAVHRVLTAYSRYDPVVGFHVSMVPTTRAILSQCEDPSGSGTYNESLAFALVSRLAFAYGWRLLLVPGGERACRLEDFVADRLLETHAPDLAEHMALLGVQASSWNASGQHICTLGRGGLVCLDGVFLHGLAFAHSLLLQRVVDYQEWLMAEDESEHLVSDLWHLLDAREVDITAPDFYVVPLDEYCVEYGLAKQAEREEQRLQMLEEIDVVHRDDKAIMRRMRELNALVANALQDREALLKQCEEQRMRLGAHVECEAVMATRIHQLETNGFPSRPADQAGK